MKNLAELKRTLRVGTKIKTLNKVVKIDSIGTIRVIDKINTTGFYMNGSFLAYPENKNLIEFNGNKFKIYQPNFRQLNEEEKSIFREYKNNCYSQNAYENYCKKLKKINKLYLKKAYFENDSIFCPYEKGMLIGEYELLEAV